MAEHEQVQQPASLQLHDYSQDVSRAKPQGRLDKLWPHDLGEQIVGTTHDYAIEAPSNIDRDKPAYARAHVEGFPGLSTSWEGVLRPNTPGKPLTFTFAPEQVGEFKGKVVFQVRWSDDTTEQHSIVITGRARKLEDVPASEHVNKHERLQSKDIPKTSNKNFVTQDDVTDHEELLTAVGVMTGSQQDGVHTVFAESQKFALKPEPESLWWDIAEFALVMGTAGVAAIVGKFLAQRLGSIVKGAEHAAEHGAEHAVKHGEPLALEGVATTIEDGIKHKMEKALKEHEKTEPAESKDDEIGFFSEQQSVLRKAERDLRNMVSELMHHLATTKPELANDIMGGMTAAFNEAADGAKRSQLNATSLQWMAYKSRSKLGTETIKDGNQQRVVTDMKEQLGHGKSRVELAELASGVLEIEVHRGEDGEIEVEGARVQDISSLIVARLLPLDLRHLGVPMRIVVNSGAVITVDEAGRPRVGGIGALDLDAARSTGTEAQQIREAERIVGIVLSKPLGSWGVERIETNDARE